MIQTQIANVERTKELKLKDVVDSRLAEEKVHVKQNFESLLHEIRKYYEGQQQKELESLRVQLRKQLDIYQKVIPIFEHIERTSYRSKNWNLTFSLLKLWKPFEVKIHKMHKN